MKIAVSKIRANPFRRIASYPIDKAKVEALKTSIRETEFWDNILLREKPGKPGLYELAYGHHRLQALKELGIAEIDVPVKDLDDATMLRIMAGASPAGNHAPESRMSLCEPRKRPPPLPVA